VPRRRAVTVFEEKGGHHACKQWSACRPANPGRHRL